MPFWSEITFTDANSPMMEQMIMFHDHTLMIIITIMYLILMIIIMLSYNMKFSMYVMDNQYLEIIWTLVPMILLIFIALPSLRLLYIMEESFTPSLTIKTMGHQWYWSYEYTDFNVNFESFMSQKVMPKSFRLLDTDNRLMIPMNSIARMLVTSMDVIHSWTIQSLGVKTDAIPGRLNQINLMPSRPGNYYGQCSEICGSNHSFMPINLGISNITMFKNFIKNM